MINHEDNSQTSIIERKTEYKPPHTWRSWLIGRPLSTADAPHQTIGKVVGLAVFASDALSSSAYAIDEILLVLILAGTGYLSLSMPIAIAIIILLGILTISYEQTIHAYPGGGGAYIVARDNLGEAPAQTAGAALLTDYILTVAVSISSGVAQITSAFPELYPWRVPIAVGLIVFMMVVNLRGVKESGTTFAIPTYFFLGMVLLTIGMGFYQYLGGSLGRVSGVEVAHAGESFHPLTLFLVLRAFAGGCTALTGVEAISNGITAFKEPRSHNAGTTLIWMSVILGINLFGLTYLANQVGVLPSHLETGFSQIGRVVYGVGSLLYLVLLGSTTLILIMAANTAFADFPRLAALVSRDGFLPKQLTFRGSRLVFSNGIIALAGVASLLVVIFQAKTNALIPLYAIGVYLSFTLSQAGMARRWYHSGQLKEGQEANQHGSILRYDPKWRTKLFINGVGSIVSAVVMMVFAVTKFREGAFIVLILIPSLISIFYMIHRHYKKLAGKLSLDNVGVIPPHTIRHRVIMPVSGVHQGTLAALRYARMLSDDVTAVHVSIEPAEAEKVRQKWETWGEGVRMVMLESPYRLLIEPVLEYIADIAERRQPGETITIVVPEFVSDNRLTGALHTNTADIL
ncbi:MAG: APC family permease, partial [Chloroflexi bacterium]|nr:APC family permease [Chloroflexota bacterium]